MPGSRGRAAALDLRRGLARGAGQVAGPLGLIYGPGKDEIIHNLCTAVIDPDGRLARLEVGTQRNKWTSADLLKTIYSLIPPGRSDHANAPRFLRSDLVPFRWNDSSLQAFVNRAAVAGRVSERFVLLDPTN